MFSSQQVNKRMAYQPSTNKESLSRCIAYVDTLTKSIKHQFQVGNLDIYAYEHQINVLSCLRLQYEMFLDDLLPVSGGLFINEEC